MANATIETGTVVRVGDDEFTVSRIKRVSVTGKLVTIELVAEDGGHWSIDVWDGDRRGNRSIGFGAGFDAPELPVVIVSEPVGI